MEQRWRRLAREASVDARRSKKLFVFDLDGTLAESKSAVSPEVAGLLVLLLDVIKVAVISGGTWTQFETQLLAQLPRANGFRNLFLLPTNGTQFFQHDQGWVRLYSEALSEEERCLIISSLHHALEMAGIKVDRTWGEVIEDRGSQITMSVLGQDAPLAVKRSWDPDFANRTRIVSLLETLLPSFAIRMGGTTSIDVTKPGIDKAYGIGKLREHLDISIGEMLFAGDAIFAGGNDFSVQESGVDSILVSGPHETARVIQTVIACVGDGSLQMKSPGRTS